MVNISQLPVGKEFVRCYLQDNGEKIVGLSVFPMINFTMGQQAFSDISVAARKHADKVFDPDDTRMAQMVLNYYINQGIAQLDAEGRIAVPEEQRWISMVECVGHYGGACVNYTDDGFVSFNASHIPLTPSPSTH